MLLSSLLAQAIEEVHMSPVRILGFVVAAVAGFAIAYTVSHGSGASEAAAAPVVAPLHVPAVAVAVPAGAPALPALARAAKPRHKAAPPTTPAHTPTPSALAGGSGGGGSSGGPIIQG